MKKVISFAVAMLVLSVVVSWIRVNVEIDIIPMLIMSIITVGIFVFIFGPFSQRRANVDDPDKYFWEYDSFIILSSDLGKLFKRKKNLEKGLEQFIIQEDEDELEKISNKIKLIIGGGRNVNGGDVSGC